MVCDRFIFFVLVLPLVIFACASPPPANVEVVVENKTTPKATPKQGFETDAKLQAQSDGLLFLIDKMPQVPVYLKDEPILKMGSETQKGVAYTSCENKTPTILVKRIFYQKANSKMLTNILKHELTHAYFCRQGRQEGHDERWRKKFSQVGGFGN